MKFKKIVSAVLAAILLFGGNIFSSTAADKVTSKDFSLEEMSLDSYDIYKYTAPFWEGNLVLNECVYPIETNDYTMKVYPLMYDASEIISVRSYDLGTSYKEGQDYYIKNGDLYFTSTGNVPVQEYGFLHPSENPNNYDFSVYYPHADGEGYEYWTGGTDISKKALVVTYIHNDTWDHPVPHSIEKDLPGTMDKLIHKKDLTIVVNGDSVSEGALSSGAQGINPYADAYPEMTAKALAAKFGNPNVKIVNTAIGGSMSHFTPELLDNTVIQHAPDLVIINYGMNDSSCDRVGIPKEEYTANIKGRIEYIQTKLPDCEIILLSSLYGNIYTFPRERYEEHSSALHEIAAEYEGVAVCDPQAIMRSIMDQGKDFVCFMADNMVHPNDFGMRIMAQTVLAALDISDIKGYRNTLISDLTSYASPEIHVADGKRDELLSVIADAKAKISTLTNEWFINEVITAAYAEVDFIVNRCAFEDHIFTHSLTPATCKTEGFTHSVCSVCTYTYDHDFVAPLGGEHIMDSGRDSTSPTYKKDGVFTTTCIRCGYEEHEDIPMLKDAPDIENEKLLYVHKGANYMATSLKPYTSGTGTVEFDICPLSFDSERTNYVGIWFSRYALCAAYNFREQQVQIVENNLPFTGLSTIYASADYEWTPDSGEFEYNWKKFAVQISGNTVKIYIDGELILESTNSLYHATDEVALPYSVGEFYMDNFKIVQGDYDPATGEGKGKTHVWTLNNQKEYTAFRNEWGLGEYTDYSHLNCTSATISTGKYSSHTHMASLAGTVTPTCSLPGYRDYVCNSCFKVVRLDHRDPTSKTGHTLINKKVVKAPNAWEDGLVSYDCANCFETFTQVVPANPHGVEYIPGDLNGNGVIDTIDSVYLDRIISEIGIPVEDLRPADINFDGVVNSSDAAIIKRELAIAK